jgi:hypothetical protein
MTDVQVLEATAVSTLKGGGDISFGGYLQDPFRCHFEFVMGPGMSLHVRWLLETERCLLKQDQLNTGCNRTRKFNNRR